MTVNIGIDIGSAVLKIVFVSEGRILWKKAVPTIPGQRKLVENIIAEGLAALSVNETDTVNIFTTGYGRKLITNTTGVINEISANALGVYLLSEKKARTVINIGGQDIKIIRISDDGNVLDFKMNDKCAAGTGRFFEIVAKIIDTPLSEFADVSLKSGTSVCLNSTCVVFAESEIVSLLADGKEKDSIIRGLHESVARRIAYLVGSMELEESIYLDGGPATNCGLIECIENELLYDIRILPAPQFTVAYGAAMSGCTR